MLRCLAVLAAAAALAGCSVRSLDGIEGAAAGPAIDQAVAACEGRLASQMLVSHEAVALCERTAALPGQLAQGPALEIFYDGVWANKAALYREVDRGHLTQEQADAQQAIDTRNMISIVRSIRRF